MVSKESEYLIHLAEEQLERLNKSLYFYQRNAQIQENLLNLSGDSLNREARNLSLTPVYTIIDRQRRGTKSREVSRSSGDTSPRRPTQKMHHNKCGSYSHSTNDNHIRDWRNMAELAQKTLGPNKQSYKCNTNDILTACSNKKEKLSTFWDYNGHKRVMKISKSAGDIEKSERGTTKCCGHRDSYSRNEIRKYIRDKQKLYKEKQCSSNLKEKFQQENMRSSLIKINNDHYDDSKVVEVEHYDHFCDEVYKSCPIHECGSNSKKMSKNQAVYDELKKEGIFDYKGPKKNSVINSPFRTKNGLNSTVDSGFETGEWLQTTIPETVTTFKDTGCGQITNVHSKREKVRNEDQIFKSPPKSKSGFNDKLKKQYKYQISAYDASSENEMGNDNAFTSVELTPPLSPNSFQENDQSPNTDKLKSILDITDGHSQFNRNISKTQILDGKLSISLPNCNSDFSCESSFKKSQKRTHLESSQICLVEELKEALLEAQRQLNPNFSEPKETLSERISRAVENFIKTKDRKTESNDILNVEIKPQRGHISDAEHSVPVKPKSESQKKHNESRKDHLSTEFEATEIEHEKFKPLSKNGKIDSSSVVKHEIVEIVEERNSFSISSDQSEVLDDHMKENITANLEIRKKDLESRRDKANELINMTREFKKESKRVILLERKACQFSKKFLKDSKFDKKTYDSRLHDLRNIGIIKFPRNTMPPDGKDSGRSEVMDSTKNHLSPRMGDPGFVKDTGKVEDCLAVFIESSPQNHSELSDVEDPTVSISEISTTITDQSELEARLVALRTEMTKKHQLVVTLKLHQKEMKRDNIKQKEITLQKQIEMYDAYISKLQNNIDELEKKGDDAIDEDSHTLTGSTSTINELGINHDTGLKVLPLVSIVFSTSDENDNSIDDMYIRCCEDDSGVKGDSFDKVVNNNKHIAGENIDLDSLSQLKEIVEISNDINDPVKASFNTTKGSEGSDIYIESIYEDIGVSTNHVNNTDFDEMVKQNTCDNDLLKDSDLEYLCTKEDAFKTEGDENILNELIIENTHVTFPKVIVSSQIKIQTTPEITMTNARSTEVFDEEKKIIDVGLNKIVKETEISSETVNVSDTTLDFSLSIIPPLKSENIVLNNIDLYHPNITVPITNNDDFNKVNDGNIKFQISYSDDDDDGSSISDIKSVKATEEDSFNDNDWNKDCKVVSNSVENCQDISIDEVPISSPVSLFKTSVSFPKPIVHSNTDNDFTNESLNSAKVEQLVEYLLNVILCSEFEEVKQQTAMMEIVKSPLLSVMEVEDFQYTSFIEPIMTILPEINGENIQYSNVLKPEDLWEFNVLDVGKSTELLEPFLISNDVTQPEEFINKDVESCSTIDIQLIEEKLKWLIPFNQDYLETYIQSAILCSFQERQSSPGVIVESSLTTHRNLQDDISVVTEADINVALFDSSKNISYIDKRIIYQLVKEIFAEIYSFERYLPQMPWTHPSFMIKRNNYTMWKGDKPPESYDLVSKIVREQMSHIFNQKNVSFNSATLKVRESLSHSKITKWCIERQKDQVDKLLINDLCKEENDWVYYDEAEEEVKVQISGDIFQFLIIDAISWLKSILSQN